MTTYSITRHPDTHPTSHVAHRHVPESYLFLAENAAGERVLLFGTGPDDRRAEEVDLGLNTASASRAVMAVLVAHLDNIGSTSRSNQCEQCGSIGQSDLDSDGRCTFCRPELACGICGERQDADPAYKRLCCTDQQMVEV